MESYKIQIPPACKEPKTATSMEKLCHSKWNVQSDDKSTTWISTKKNINGWWFWGKIWRCLYKAPTSCSTHTSNPQSWFNSTIDTPRHKFKLIQFNSEIIPDTINFLPEPMHSTVWRSWIDHGWSIRNWIWVWLQSPFPIGLTMGGSITVEWPVYMTQSVCHHGVQAKIPIWHGPYCSYPSLLIWEMVRPESTHL